MTQNQKQQPQELQLPSQQQHEQQEPQQQQQQPQQDGENDDYHKQQQQLQQPQQESQQQQQQPKESPRQQQPQQPQQPQKQQTQQPQKQENKLFSSDAELLRDLAKSQPAAQSPHEKRIGLIAAMGHFRPKNATPIQFYNYVREFCIMHNCSIDEAMERAPDAWTKLSKDQRKLYNSTMHAALPIPVPRHLIYRAFQMERAGRWKISQTPAANGNSTTYSMESYSPPVKPTKLQARLKAQQPRYDNLAETVPCILETPRTLPTSSTSSSPKTKTPPEQRAAAREKPALSLRDLLSEPNLKGLRKTRAKPVPAAPATAQLPPKQQRQPPAKCKSKKQLNTSSVKKQQQQQQQQQQPEQEPKQSQGVVEHAQCKPPNDAKRKQTHSKKSKAKS